jgi:hypothetical protein
MEKMVKNSENGENPKKSTWMYMYVCMPHVFCIFMPHVCIIYVRPHVCMYVYVPHIEGMNVLGQI